jgi:hypothetical protein
MLNHRIVTNDENQSSKKLFGKSQRNEAQSKISQEFEEKKTKQGEKLKNCISTMLDCATIMSK